MRQGRAAGKRWLRSTVGANVASQGPSAGSVAGGIASMQLHGILSCSSVSKTLSASLDTQCSAPFRVNFEGQQTESCPHEERGCWD